MDFTTALPVFFVTLREGVEASLIVGIVLACLTQAKATALHRQVYAGVAAGLFASLLLGTFLSIGLNRLGASSWLYAPVLEQAVKGTIAIVAIVLLSWMLVWMTQQAKGLRSEVEQSVTASLQQNTTWGIFSLIFIAVVREGVETVLFVGAQIQEGWIPVFGAILGISGAIVIGLLIFKGGIKINLRLFFQGMGILLLLIVAGLVVTALRKFEGAIELWGQLDPTHFGWCNPQPNSCILGIQVWDLSQVLPDQTFPGILFKSFFGYTQLLYLAQAIAYVVFLIGMGRYYWSSLNR